MDSPWYLVQAPDGVTEWRRGWIHERYLTVLSKPTPDPDDVDPPTAAASRMLVPMPAGIGSRNTHPRSASDQRADGFDGVLQQTLDPDFAFSFELSPLQFGPPRFDVLSYVFFQGTSMASPHVAGLAALLMAQGVTDPGAIEAGIKATATDLGAPGADAEFGAGLVNADVSAPPPLCAGLVWSGEGDASTIPAGGRVCRTDGFRI